MPDTKGPAEIKEAAYKAEVIKRSVAGIGRGLSESADRVADIIIDEDKSLNGAKTRKVADETLSMFKGVTRQLCIDLKGVKGCDLINVAAYGAGKVSGRVKRGFLTLFE